MPIFEYRCEDCARGFEKLVLSSDAPAATCLHCGSGRVKKLFSAFATTNAGPSSLPMASGPSEGPGCGRCGSMNPCGMS